MVNHIGRHVVDTVRMTLATLMLEGFLQHADFVTEVPRHDPTIRIRCEKLRIVFVEHIQDIGTNVSFPNSHTFP